MKIGRKATIILKATATTWLVAGMVYSPTYYATDPMKNNYAWIWGGLILFAIWTKRSRPIVKSIASIGPALFGGSFLVTLFTNPEVWHISIGMILLAALFLSSIWLKRPLRESPIATDADHYESRESRSSS